MLRALLRLGVPYADALAMPLDFALLLLDAPQKSSAPPSASTPLGEGRMVAARRKSKESG